MQRVRIALGDRRKVPMASERNTAEVACKILVAACDIQAGMVLIDEYVPVRCPGKVIDKG